MPALLGVRKIIHPLLLDPTSHYQKSLGLQAWPLATMLDRKGRVVWQGASDRGTFAEACGKALEKLMQANPKKGVGSDSDAR